MTTRISYSWTTPKEKPCKRCGRLLPIACFYENTSRPPWTKGRFSTQCKACATAEKRERYHARLSVSRAASRRHQAAYSARVREEHRVRLAMSEAAWRALKDSKAVQERMQYLRRESVQQHKALQPYRGPHPVSVKIKSWLARKRIEEQMAYRDHLEAAARRVLNLMELHPECEVQKTRTSDDLNSY